MYVRATQDIAKDSEVGSSSPESILMCHSEQMYPVTIVLCIFYCGTDNKTYEFFSLQLCVSYINLYEPRGVRKQNLADTKHFDCSCPRCSEPLISSIDRFLEVGGLSQFTISRRGIQS